MPSSAKEVNEKQIYNGIRLLALTERPVRLKLMVTTVLTITINFEMKRIWNVDNCRQYALKSS